MIDLILHISVIALRFALASIITVFTWQAIRVINKERRNERN